MRSDAPRHHLQHGLWFQSALMLQMCTQLVFCMAVRRTRCGARATDSRIAVCPRKRQQNTPKPHLRQTYLDVLPFHTFRSSDTGRSMAFAGAWRSPPWNEVGWFLDSKPQRTSAFHGVRQERPRQSCALSRMRDPLVDEEIASAPFPTTDASKSQLPRNRPRWPANAVSNDRRLDKRSTSQERAPATPIASCGASLIFVVLRAVHSIKDITHLLSTKEDVRSLHHTPQP